MISTLLLCARIGLGSSRVYLGMTMIAAVEFSRRRRLSAKPPETVLPAVSVLKPVHGTEPNLSASLESLFQQRRDRYELVFGARSADDSALAVVEELRSRRPHVPTRIVLAGFFTERRIVWRGGRMRAEGRVDRSPSMSIASVPLAASTD
jgi:ceramide glucosyltransferase